MGSPVADNVAPDALCGAEGSHDSSPRTSSPPTPDSPAMVHRSKTAPPPRAESSGSDEDEELPDTSLVSDPESMDTPTGILSPPSSVLRRSRSSVDATNSLRVTKHLRFTAVGDASALRVTTDDNVIYPGGTPRRRKRNVPRDQEWLLSGPPTPNISETYVSCTSKSASAT